MAKLEKMSRSEILKLIKPAFFASFGDDAKSNWDYIKGESSGPGGTDWLRSWVKDNGLDDPDERAAYLGMNKGGSVKKSKMNKGGMIDYRSKGLFK